MIILGTILTLGVMFLIGYYLNVDGPVRHFIFLARRLRNPQQNQPSAGQKKKMRRTARDRNLEVEISEKQKMFIEDLLAQLCRERDRADEAIASYLSLAGDYKVLAASLKETKNINFQLHEAVAELKQINDPALLNGSSVNKECEQSVSPCENCGTITNSASFLRNNGVVLCEECEQILNGLLEKEKNLLPCENCGTQTDAHSFFTNDGVVLCDECQNILENEIYTDDEESNDAGM